MKYLPRMLQLAALLLACLASQGCGDSDDAIAAARGEWLFINYWATWCKPCRREIPELNALNEREGYAVLGVNYDGTLGEALAKEERDLAISFPTLTADPAQRYQVERPQVLPTTLVITPAGKLAQVLVGPQTEDSLLAATRSGNQ
jgi:thiol-disulfide isomerase/thioredoxin